MVEILALKGYGSCLKIVQKSSKSLIKDFVPEDRSDRGNLCHEKRKLIINC